MGAIKLGLYPEYFSEARDPIDHPHAGLLGELYELLHEVRLGC